MKNKKTTIILLSTAVVLCLLYILSFTKILNHKDNRKIIKTALVNPKYENAISKIQLSNASSQKYLELIKKDNLWIVQNESSSFSIPGDENFIRIFLQELTKIRELYVTSKKIDQNNNFGLNDGSEFHLRYYVDSGNYDELIFGNQDFSQTFRYLMTGKSLQVYEIDDSMDRFLSLSTQIWADPLIISQNVAGRISVSDVQRVITQYNDEIFILDPEKTENWTEKVSKLLDLRHGGISSFVPENNSIFSLKIELGNKNQIFVSFYETLEEGNYLLKCKYENAADSKNYQFQSVISQWTYNKIREIML